MNRVRTILVAEDDEDDRLLLAEAFAAVDADVDVEFACDGRELMARLEERREPSPLVLLDLNMPRMNGREVLRAMRDAPEHRRTPVVVMSTSDAEIDVHDAYDLGANSFVAKPMGYRNLVGSLRVLLDFWTQAALVATGPQEETLTLPAAVEQ